MSQSDAQPSGHDVHRLGHLRLLLLEPPRFLRKMSESEMTIPTKALYQVTPWTYRVPLPFSISGSI